MGTMRVHVRRSMFVGGLRKSRVRRTWDLGGGEAGIRALGGWWVALLMGEVIARWENKWRIVRTLSGRNREVQERGILIFIG